MPAALIIIYAIPTLYIDHLKGGCFFFFFTFIGYFFYYYFRRKCTFYAFSVYYPDQLPRSSASDLGLPCLPMFLLSNSCHLQVPTTDSMNN